MREIKGRFASPGGVAGRLERPVGLLSVRLKSTISAEWLLWKVFV